MFVHCRERSQTQSLGDFLVAGAVAAFLKESCKKVQELLLPFGECHRSSMAKKRVIFKRKVRLRRSRTRSMPFAPNVRGVGATGMERKVRGRYTDGRMRGKSIATSGV